VAVTHHQTVKAAVVWAVNGVVMGVVAVMMASVSGVGTGAICTGMCAIGSSWLNIGDWLRQTALVRPVTRPY
jgi:hypothetical protein